MTNIRDERGGGQADDTNAESVANVGNEGEGRIGKSRFPSIAGLFRGGIGLRGQRVKAGR